MNVLPFCEEGEVSVAIPRAADHLRQGGLLGYPTETVYGLGSGLDRDALAALRALKDRDREKPFLLLVSGPRMAEEWGVVFDERARALADAFWPGPLTLVLPTSSSRLPDELSNPEGGVAVRRTSLAGIQSLITEIDHPLTSTSANRAGRTPVTDIAALRRDFGDVAGLMMLDGGVLERTGPSTILDCTAPHLRVVREGAIPPSELATYVSTFSR